MPGYIARLRHEERVDLILVISHLGFPQEVQLAEEVSGIDVLLSGHTHHRLYRPAVVNGAKIGSDAYVLSDADKRFGTYTIVRRGKRNHALMVWVQ